MEVTGNVSHLSKGQKIEQIRKLMGISQTELGKRLAISKQAVSKMERTEKISRNRLDSIATVLDISADAIEDFTQEKIEFHIRNMYDNSTAYAHNFECSNSPIDKVIELYERLLQLEKDKVQILKDKLQKDSPI